MLFRSQELLSPRPKPQRQRASASPRWSRVASNRRPTRAPHRRPHPALLAPRCLGPPPPRHHTPPGAALAPSRTGSDARAPPPRRIRRHPPPQPPPRRSTSTPSLCFPVNGGEAPRLRPPSPSVSRPGSVPEISSSFRHRWFPVGVVGGCLLPLC